MNKQDNRYFLARRFFLTSLLSVLGVVAIITGMIRDQKSFYGVAFICMSIACILAFFNSRALSRSK